MELRQLIVGALLYFALPVWLLAGIADYLCHRRTAIEATSGVAESTLHVVQAIEVGIPLLAGLFFEINSLVLAVMLAGVVTHTLTALWDGLYTQRRRYISPVEQHIHSHLEYIPIVAVLLVALLYWDAFRALFGVGSQPASFVLEPKHEPIPPRYLAIVLVPVLFVQGALLLEEFARTWRHARHAPAAAALSETGNGDRAGSLAP
jgi:hypothetical protein